MLRVWQAADGQFTVGRDPDCEIQIDNLALNPRHAEIILSGDQAQVRDLSEDQSLRINGETGPPPLLSTGDILDFGKYSVLYEYSLDPPRPAEPAAVSQFPADNGWLQFLNGPKLGRTMKLNSGPVQVGEEHKPRAMIISREDGYYISHLAGSPPASVRGEPLQANSVRLHDGDTIEVGDTKMMFFID